MTHSFVFTYMQQQTTIDIDRMVEWRAPGSPRSLGYVAAIVQMQTHEDMIGIPCPSSELNYPYASWRPDFPALVVSTHSVMADMF